MLHICASEFATQVTVLRPISPSQNQDGKSKNFSNYSLDQSLLLLLIYGAVLLKVKRPEHEVDHSPPSTADVKSEWSYTSFPPTCLHIKHHGDNLTYLQGIYINLFICISTILYKINMYNNGVVLWNDICLKGQQGTYREHGDLKDNVVI
jgi:hypothetical protein